MRANFLRNSALVDYRLWNSRFGCLSLESMASWMARATDELIIEAARQDDRPVLESGHSSRPQ